VTQDLRLSANLSILYADLPRDERPSAAARDGFTYVESWWPFDTPTADKSQVDAFCTAFDRAGVQLVALNLDAGDIVEGERGLLSNPEHIDRVAANLETVDQIVTRTNCLIVNALYGNREPQLDPAEQDDLALSQVVRVANRLGEHGVTVVIETLNHVESPRFPLTDLAVSADVVRRANDASRYRNVRLLLDTYHLATMGTDPADAVRQYAALIGHVQFADFPGRGRPGTGGIDFDAVETALRAFAYDGFIGHEYNPAVAPRTHREGIA
jgi:hydroxypyruvate isomerase